MQSKTLIRHFPIILCIICPHLTTFFTIIYPFSLYLLNVYPALYVFNTCIIVLFIETSAVSMENRLDKLFKSKYQESEDRVVSEGDDVGHEPEVGLVVPVEEVVRGDVLVALLRFPGDILN